MSATRFAPHLHHIALDDDVIIRIGEIAFLFQADYSDFPGLWPDLMKPIRLDLIDGAILIVYFAFVLGIGFVLKRHMRTSTDFFLSGRLIPTWVAGLAFLSANLGAQEVIGMAASGAKYAIMTSHFYWVGAIPAMVFV